MSSFASDLFVNVSQVNFLEKRILICVSVLVSTVLCINKVQTRCILKKPYALLHFANHLLIGKKEMAIYPSLVRRIISLLLLIIQDRVGSTSLGGDIIADTTLALNGSPYVASQDLVVAENATLTIQPGVQLHFDVGVGLQVKGSLQAKGNLRQRIAFTKTPTNGSVNVDDLNISAPYSDGIRLSDGDSYRVGRLEIFLNGQWGTVCDDSWDMRDTEIIKTQPGHLLAVHYQSMSGERFELEVHDGNTTNATQLTLVNQWTGANQAVTPSLSSGHELYIRFRYNADSRDARVKFLITDDQEHRISDSVLSDNVQQAIKYTSIQSNLY
ncbi:hypothetical protein ACROYT_G034376 [Oculina patagonica]